MKRPRFSVRTMMALVALVAVGIGGEMMIRRWLQYRRLATYYARHEAWARSNLKSLAGNPRVMELHRHLIGHYAEERAKYERAARYPWLSVEPAPLYPE